MPCSHIPEEETAGGAVLFLRGPANLEGLYSPFHPSLSDAIIRFAEQRLWKIRLIPIYPERAPILESGYNYLRDPLVGLSDCLS